MTTNHESFSPEFINFLTNAPMDEIEWAYAESFKDAHGIKARWIVGAGIPREDFGAMFVSLGHEIDEAIERDRAYDVWYEAEEAHRNAIETEANDFYARMYVTGDLTTAEQLAGRVGYEDEL